MISLSGKTALVTGAGKRLGRAIALTLAERGANVVLHCRLSVAEAGRVAGAIRAMGRFAWVIQADLSRSEDAEAMIDRAAHEAGSLDFLINSASAFPEGRLVDMTPDEFHSILDVNAFSPFAAARRFAGLGGEGAVVNLLDARVTDYDREHAAYHVAKRVLRDFTRMMAVEFAPSVRVNAVAPGLILPPDGKDESYLDGLAGTNALRRHGCAEDVAEAVAFLLQSDFVTGQVLYVDGGRNLRGNMYGCRGRFGQDLHS
jgi:NAD(P)-dependent dehydrogenase (short-subunit alcohol dehydrogenase family)